jgi:hypothetical protein
MTETEVTAVQHARDRTVIVQVPPDSRLETLLCTWEVVKDKRDAADAAYDELKAGILKELTSLHPDLDIKNYDIPGSRMWPALNYGYQETPYVPDAMLREHLPPVYEAFKKMKQSWILRKRGKRG